MVKIALRAVEFACQESTMQIVFSGMKAKQNAVRKKPLWLASKLIVQMGGQSQ